MSCLGHTRHGLGFYSLLMLGSARHTPHTTGCVGDAGTPHKPPIISKTGYCIFESMACANLLMQQGVPGERILRETSSFDTIGNAYFSATIFSLPCSWQNVTVATSAFHMPRSRAIFEKVFELLDKEFGRQCVLSRVLLLHGTSGCDCFQGRMHGSCLLPVFHRQRPFQCRQFIGCPQQLVVHGSTMS
jgi:hypothetical protein